MNCSDTQIPKPNRYDDVLKIVDHIHQVISLTRLAILSRLHIHQRKSDSPFELHLLDVLSLELMISRALEYSRRRDLGSMLLFFNISSTT